MAGFRQQDMKLAVEVERVFEQLAARRLVAWATGWISGAAWWLRCLIFSAFTAGVTALAALLLREPRNILGIHLWAGILLWVALVLFERLARRIVEISEAQITELKPEAIEKMVHIAHSHPLLRWQTLISALIGGLTALLLGPLLYAVTGTITPATYFTVIFGSTLTTNLIYIPASATVFALLLRGESGLFPLEPAESSSIRGLNEIGQEVVRSTAGLATVGVIGPFLIPGIGPIALGLAALVFTGATLATLAQYFLQRMILSQVIRERRESTLISLQAEISGLYARLAALGDAELIRLETLVLMHQQTARASRTAFSLSDLVDILSPLLVPLISLAVGSLNLQVSSDQLGLLLDLLGLTLF